MTFIFNAILTFFRNTNRIRFNEEKQKDVDFIIRAASK